MNIQGCRLIELPKISDARGNLSVVENLSSIPFEIRRVYYLYDTPTDQGRGEHAHKSLQQLAIAVAGSLDFVLDNGTQREQITLDKPNMGLYIGPSIWREMINFSADAVCIVLASEIYDEADYIRNYKDFLHSLSSN